VTLPALLRSWHRDVGTGRLHIAHILDHFCREVYGKRSFEVLNPDIDLPPVDGLAFPAEYFGPDAPPVYEDGALKEQPCLRIDRCPQPPLKVSMPETSTTYDWRKIGRAFNDRGWRRYIGPKRADHGIIVSDCDLWMDRQSALHHYKGEP